MQDEGIPFYFYEFMYLCISLFSHRTKVTLQKQQLSPCFSGIVHFFFSTPFSSLCSSSEGSHLSAFLLQFYDSGIGHKQRGPIPVSGVMAFCLSEVQQADWAVKHQSVLHAPWVTCPGKWLMGLLQWLQMTYSLRTGASLITPKPTVSPRWLFCVITCQSPASSEDLCNS